MEDRKPSPFADLLSGGVWLALAIGIVILSWKMDRLTHLQATIYTAPGLVPALLGIAIAIMGVLLILRSIRAGALGEAQLPRFSPRAHWRILSAVALCLAFALGLLGSGLPFWLAAAIFIATFVFVFQFEEREAAGTLLRGAAYAAVFGLICGGSIHYVFQELFLVRLP
ncbi:MAG: tripartite tricarboxylate transporter TctB family protein [Pseudorhodoplanes sp.]|uniref:tripartite tricarboxylate transporter TctB family protein n=1 Tax=Pseudorhodoplanes sp. TaxID=1934341 RepID=UPI003D0D27F4